MKIDTARFINVSCYVDFRRHGTLSVGPQKIEVLKSVLNQICRLDLVAGYNTCYRGQRAYLGNCIWHEVTTLILHSDLAPFSNLWNEWWNYIQHPCSLRGIRIPHCLGICGYFAYQWRWKSPFVTSSICRPSCYSLEEIHPKVVRLLIQNLMMVSCNVFCISELLWLPFTYNVGVSFSAPQVSN